MLMLKSWRLSKTKAGLLLVHNKTKADSTSPMEVIQWTCKVLISFTELPLVFASRSEHDKKDEVGSHCLSGRPIQLRFPVPEQIMFLHPPLRPRFPTPAAQR